MNGTNRLYRSTSEAMVGGVAAGLANYFKTDPTIVRAAFVILTILTGGAFIVPYLILWLLVPTAGSTATTPGGVVQENIDEMGAKLRSAWKVPGNGNSANFAASSETPNAGTNVANGGPSNGGVGNGYAIQTQCRPHYGILPLVLIVVGVFVLFGHIGFFHHAFWGGFWPLLMIGLGILFLTRRNRWNRQ